MVAKGRTYTRVLVAYLRDACNLRSFLRLTQIRLSQSKVGWFVCPRRITARIDSGALGRGVLIRSHTTDITVFGEVVAARVYEPLAAAAGREVATVVDLGAYIGLSSRWLLNQFPSARLLAVEPEPGNVEILRENLTTFGARARVVSACIGARERKVQLLGSREDAYRMEDALEGDVEVVTMRTVFDALDTDRADVLKVDIEGAERELFADCASWIQHVGVISVECHLPFTADDLVALLEQNGVAPEVLSATAAPSFGYEMVFVRVASRA